VIPQVAVAGSAGSFLALGRGFTGTSAVSIGATAASSFTVQYDDAVSVNYPANLSLGSQPVTLTGSATPFTGSLFVVSPQAYAATTLGYPQQPDHVLATVWDAQRQVLYVAAAFAQSASNVVWRYAYANGSWSAAQTISIPDLRDLVLSNDATKLMALTSTAVLEFDATNPGSPTRTVTAPFTSGGANNTPIMLRFAFANDNHAFIATGLAGVAANTDSYIYQPITGTFFDLGSSSQLQSTAAGVGAGLVVSGDGSMIVASQNSTTAKPFEMEYLGGTGGIYLSNLPRPQVLDEPVAIDASAQSIVVNDGTNVDFVQTHGSSVATLPFSGTHYLVAVMNLQGTRTFVLEDDGKLHSFATNVNFAQVTEIGTGVALAPPSIQSPTLRTAITPDGATMFIAGDAGVAVVPAPN